MKTSPTVRKVGNEKAVQDCVRRCEVSSLKHLFWISALISSPTRLLAPRAAPVSGGAVTDAGVTVQEKDLTV